MATTSDDIERMLQAIENRQVKCPECGGTDANMKRATYELSAVRFTMTGEIIVGEQYDYADPNRGEFPSMLVCHGCRHEWPVPEGTTLQWESVICECEEARLRRQQEELVFLSANEPVCENDGCNQTCIYVIEGAQQTTGIPYGTWYHVDTRGCAGERKCAVKKTHDGKQWDQYARVTLG